MKSTIGFLLVCSALIAFASGSSIAQTQPTQNPFGGAAPQTAPAPAAKKARSAPVTKAGQFANETDAKANCPGEPVVWANTSTKIYHHAGNAAYGTTKRGAYMCEKDAAAAGIRAAKNEKG